MATRLSAPLKRELAVAGDPYTLTITPDGLKLVRKGRRKGYELTWHAVVSGDAALAAALNASLKRGSSVQGQRRPIAEKRGNERPRKRSQQPG